MIMDDFVKRMEHKPFILLIRFNEDELEVNGQGLAACMRRATAMYGDDWKPVTAAPQDYYMREVLK